MKIKYHNFHSISFRLQSDQIFLNFRIFPIWKTSSFVNKNMYHLKFLFKKRIKIKMLLWNKISFAFKICNLNVIFCCLSNKFYESTIISKMSQFRSFMLPINFNFKQIIFEIIPTMVVYVKFWPYWFFLLFVFRLYWTEEFVVA